MLLVDRQGRREGGLGGSGIGRPNVGRDGEYYRPYGDSGFPFSIPVNGMVITIGAYIIY